VDPPPIPNGAIHYVEEVDHNDDEFTVSRLEDHEVDMNVFHGAFVDYREVVEHDPIHQLTIVQTADENPPPKPPDLELEFDLSNILTHNISVFYDVSGFDAIIRPLFTQISVPQDSELPLSARQPPDPY